MSYPRRPRGCSAIAWDMSFLIIGTRSNKATRFKHTTDQDIHLDHVACRDYWQFWPAYGTPLHVVFGARKKLSCIEKQPSQLVRDPDRISPFGSFHQRFQIECAIDTPASSSHACITNFLRLLHPAAMLSFQAQGYVSFRRMRYASETFCVSPSC